MAQNNQHLKVLTGAFIILLSWLWDRSYRLEIIFTNKNRIDRKYFLKLLYWKIYLGKNSFPTEGTHKKKNFSFIEKIFLI